MIQLRDSVTARYAIARQFDTLKNKTGTGHLRERDDIFEARHEVKDFLPFELLT